MKKLLLTTALILSATTLTAQSTNCASHDQVVERLASQYGEVRVSIGLGSDNSVVETFASQESGSWTITVTKAGGPTCLVAAGQSFQLLNEVLPDEDT